MARRYVMTARRKAALRKAQLASARKRKGSRRRKVVAGAVGTALVVGAARHKLSGSNLTFKPFKNPPGTYNGKHNFGGFMRTTGRAKSYHILGGLQTRKRGFGVSYTHYPFFTTKKRQIISRGKLRLAMASIYSR